MISYPVLSYPLFYLYLESMYCMFTHTHSPNSDLKLLWRQFEQNRCRQAVTVQVRSKTPRGEGRDERWGVWPEER
jgi:hypothetical protein